jgi:hypothetical protein
MLQKIVEISADNIFPDNRYRATPGDLPLDNPGGPGRHLRWGVSGQATPVAAAVDTSGMHAASVNGRLHENHDGGYHVVN